MRCRILNRYSKLKVGNPNAWIQGGNSFGTTGTIGTKDNNHMDFITNNSQRMRLDRSGALLVGFTANSGNKLDVNGQARIVGVASASANDVYDIRLFPGYNNGYATGVNASMIAFGSSNVFASIGIIKQTMGNLPDGYLLIGATRPGKVTAITDIAHNPIFVVEGNGLTTINGGYTSIGPGDTIGTGSNGNATTFAAPIGTNIKFIKSKQ